MRNITFLDGGMGTLLQAKGLCAGETPEDWNVDRPEDVAAVHSAYVAAGSQVIYANTFGANRLKYHGRHTLEKVIRAGLAVAGKVKVEKRGGGGQRKVQVALDLGPTGRLLKPAGDLDFDEAVDAFAETIRIAGQSPVVPDLVVIETMGDVGELKAAVIAAKETCDLPIYATVTLGADGKLLTGASVECVAALLESLGVDAYGFNCGLGPEQMLPYVERLAKVSTKPLIVKPNAGLPKVVDGKTVFTVGPDVFAGQVAKLVAAGASIVGGCCGTTPAHIAATVKERGDSRQTTTRRAKPVCRLSSVAPLSSVGCRLSPPLLTQVSSSTSVVTLASHQGLIIGERINPTGKKALKEAYRSGDTAYVLREAVKQVDAGAEILDVNCGVPGLDEAALLDATVVAVQSVVTCPLQVDTADPGALERALRHVNGKALVNSVNGKRESMDAVFPLVKKYGGAIVALCLDESGIPATSEGRLAIARRILAEGAKYGFGKNDFVFDALTLAVSSDPQAALVTLETVRRLTDELGVNTVLGVSNVSFGLPNRPALNNAMYALAKRAGLSAAIANPSAIRDEIDPAAEDVLLGRDPNCARWIESNSVSIESNKAGLGSARVGIESASVSIESNRGRVESNRVGIAPARSTSKRKTLPDANPTLSDPNSTLTDPNLFVAIRRGLREDARHAAAAALAAGQAPMDVIQSAVVPALEEVGRGFEKGTVYLPQLLMAADAAGEAFAVVKEAMAKGEAGRQPTDDNRQPGDRRQPTAGSKVVVLATVKGDIHDIGKNIVRALLENYGFDVIDLGRDVPPEKIVDAARQSGAKLVGLSALMTTTVGAMAETIRQLKAAGLACKTVVGGAVVTQEFADEIGADFYAKDAMRTVRVAESVAGKGL